MGQERNAHPLRTISQIGVVVPDLDLVIGAMKRIFGALPDTVAGPSDKSKYYYGRQVDSVTRIALYQFANIELEFIQPVSGEGVWQDFLREKGAGVHHVKFSVSDMDQAGRAVREAGYTESMCGDSAFREGLRWSYIETGQDLGFALELFDDLI